jgi:hypothetical protein
MTISCIYILDDISNNAFFLTNSNNVLLIVAESDLITNPDNCFITGSCPSTPYNCSSQCKERGFQFGGLCYHGSGICCCRPNI